MAQEKVRITSESELVDKLQPIVLGADLFDYTLVREFHRVYGLRSIVLATADVKVVSTSRFCDYHIVEGIDSEDVLITKLMQLGEQLADKGKLGLVIGSGDWYARILSQHKEELETWLVVPYIDFELLNRITQKEIFYDACEQLGIDYPKTWYLDCEHYDENFDATSFVYPLIAKPSNSATYHYAEFEGKKKIFEVETPEELARIYKNLAASSYAGKLIVQDFIPGEDDGLHTITTYSDRNGKVCMSCMGQVVLQDHEPSALGNPVVIRSKRIEAVLNQAKRLLEHFGYRGFANFDVKYDPRDGAYRFFEVNTRAGRNTFYVTLAGADFVRLYVEDFVLGQELVERNTSKDFCFACVPAAVVSRSVKDPELRHLVLGMYRSGLAKNPQFYAPDTALHQFWALVTYYNQIRKFKRFLWDTGGKQAAV